MRAHNILFATALITFCLCLSACSSHAPVVLKSDQNPNAVNVIALLPVEGNVADTKALQMLRTKLSNELRFKGYSQIASDLVDSKLIPLTDDKDVIKNKVIPPKAIEELLGADGAMYCSLKESKTSTGLFYAPVTVSVRCELRSTKTGETVWNDQSQATNRSFDLIRTRLKMKSNGDLEAALEEVVGKVMETLPYGPKLRG
jgi:hypothetical protein